MVTVTGLLRKHGLRYSVEADVEATARLTCDRSLEEFDEVITTSISLDYVVDHTLAAAQRGRTAELDDEEVRGIREEDKVIDVSEDVRQVLRLSIPLRAVAPAYRDKELDEIHPSMREGHESESDGPIDERWSALAKLKRQ